jgi:spermidine/putrescine transport system substrate-binding protein
MTEDGKQTSVGRRTFLAGSSAAAVALAGCAGGGDGGDGGDGGTTGTTDAAPFAGETLRVSTWSGTNEQIFRETIKPMYEERVGGTLEVVGNWTQILSKIRAAPADDPPYDLTVGGSRIHYLGDQADLWEPVRYENVPNAEVIRDSLTETRSSEKAVPIAYGVMCYAYDEDSLSWQPGEWSDLTTTAERVALPGSYYTNALMMGAIISEAEPMEQEIYSADGLDTVFETLGQVPISKFYSGAQDLWSAIGGGTANVGQYFFAYSVAKDRASDSLNVGVHVPERTTGYVDFYQIVRGTQHRAMAEDFLDFLLSAEAQSAYADSFNLGTANPEAELPELSRRQLPTTDAELENVAFQRYSELAQEFSDIRQRYEEFKSSV